MSNTDYARIQFKEYVNTLALIRQEENDKYLVLKPIFYPSEFPLANERVGRDPVVDASYHSIGLPPPQYVAPPPHHLHYGQPQSVSLDATAPAFRAPPPYRPPPEPAPFRRSSLSGSDLSHSPVNVFPTPYSNYQPPPPHPVIAPLLAGSQKHVGPAPSPPVHHFVRQTSLPSDDFIPASAYLLPQQQPMTERSVSIQDFTSSSVHLVQDLTSSASPVVLPVVPPRRLKTQRSDDKENQLVRLIFILIIHWDVLFIHLFIIIVVVVSLGQFGFIVFIDRRCRWWCWWPQQ